jgi:hypothetical protein
VSGSGSSSNGASAATGSSSSSAFITLADLHRLTMDVSLSEADIGDVKVGQSATVTVNAADDVELAAHVASIGVLASSSSTSTGTSTSGSGAVSYPVTVVLEQGAKGVRSGMSATADIVTARASGVVVPSQAVTGSTVTVLENGKRTTRRVQTGVVGDSSTEILSGLEAGETVVVTSRSAAAGAAGSTGTTGAAQGQRTGLGGVRGGGGFGGFGGAGGGVRSGGGFSGAGPPGAGP